MSKKTKKNNQNSTKKTKPKRTKSNSGVAARLLVSAAPFAIFALALFLETCLILGSGAGEISAAVRKVMYGLLGYSAHALCVLLLVFAFFFGDIRSKGTMRYKVLMASGLALVLSALNSVIAQKNIVTATLDFGKFFESGTRGESGGVIGDFFGTLTAKLLPRAALIVIFTVGAVALITFTVGTYRLGIWRIFTKHKEPMPKEKSAQKPAQKPAISKRTLAALEPAQIDTVIEGENILPSSLPELAAASAPALLPEQYGEYTVDAQLVDESSNEPAIDENDDFDFGIPYETQEVFTPSQLMEQFGINSEEDKEQDIYDETPKPAPKAPATPQKQPVSGGVSYSPFANPLKSQEEVFKNQPVQDTKQPKKPQAVAYSPFADPMRSIEDKKPITAQDEKIWNEIKQNAPAASSLDSESECKEDAQDISRPYLAKEQSAPTPAPIQTAAFAPQSAIVTPIIRTEATVTEFGTPVYDASLIATHDAPPQENTTPAFAPRITDSAFDEIVTPEQEDEGAKRADAPDPRIKSPYKIYNKLRYPRYSKPSPELLDAPDPSAAISEKEIYETQSKLHTAFENFHINAAVTGYSVGPSITRYEITPGPGVKTKQITSLGEDIALALQAENRKGDIRIVTVQGKSVMGVEVPNSKVSKVSLRTLIENKDFQKAKSKITVCVGLTVSGKPIFMNIDDMPHVLVAGQTKSGKSVAINCMIISLIYRASPDEVQLILIDPKRVELNIYNDIPHMIMPVIDEPKRAAAALKWAVDEMERRYDLLNKAHVRNRDEYYATRDQNPDFEYMPQIVIIIDELADLMLQMRDNVETLINRLAAMARACGMHVVIGTQRPSVDVVTGLIKANIPSHIAFKVSSQTDSRVILGNVGAEKLLGRGDMLYHPTGGNQIRAQGAFVDTPEIKRILSYIIEKNGKAEYDPEVLYALQNETDKLNKVEKKSASEDDFAIDGYDPDFALLCQAAELVLNMGKATTNVIQRHLKIGFNRAANIVDELETLGFISAPQGSKPRDVLIDWKTYEEWKSNKQP